jgi:hypothetical protein
MKFLAEYDEEVRDFERAHPGEAAAAAGVNPKLPPGGKEHPVHPKDRPKTAQQAELLKNRDLVALRPKAIAVHCTHGFNRSGYVMVHYAKRMFPALSVAECLKQCASIAHFAFCEFTPTIIFFTKTVCWAREPRSSSLVPKMFRFLYPKRTQGQSGAPDDLILLPQA